MNKPWKIPYESFQRIAGTLPAINFHFQPALKTVWSIWEAELTQFEKKNIARELKTNNFLNLSVKELDFALLDLKIQNSNVESIDYNLILQHRAKINGITFDSPATSRGTDSPLLSKPKSSLVTANMMAQELEFRLSILADRLIYNQGNSEINLFDFHFKTKDRANIFFSELGVFSFLAGEPVNFIRQPVSYGGGLSYIQEMGLKAEAFVGLLYSENRMRFFPKIRFQILRQTSEFGPEIDVYFLGSTIHLRGTLSPYDSIFEIQKTWNNTYTTSLLAMKNFKASAPEGQINFGRFF